MIKIVKKLSAVICSLSLLLLTGCVDLETSESNTTSTESKANTVTTVETEEEEKSISIETKANYGDPELKISYNRPSGSPPIKRGSSGDEVGWLQEALNKAMSAGISVDCSFGQGTESKVLSFQSRCGLEVDGIVGPATISTLVEVVSGKRTMPPEVVQIATNPPVRNSNDESTQKTVNTPAAVQSIESDYIVNTNTGKFHYPSCKSVGKMNEENKWYYHGTREGLINQGYTPCGNCHP